MAQHRGQRQPGLSPRRGRWQGEWSWGREEPSDHPPVTLGPGGSQEKLYLTASKPVFKSASGFGEMGRVGREDKLALQTQQALQEKAVGPFPADGNMRG